MGAENAGCSLFPYEKPRKVQSEMLERVREAVENRKSLIVHAPTGLGKTAAALSPALQYALENKKTVFFLTSRHTQHIMAISTLNEIRRKHGRAFVVADVIGKKWMCAVPGISLLNSGDFSEYCKSAREEGTCAFYSLTKQENRATMEARKALAELKQGEFPHAEEMVRTCTAAGLCPY